MTTESIVRYGNLSCIHCEATGLVSWEKGDEWVRCPQCKAENKVPEGKPFPSGVCSLCFKPLDAHFGKCPK